MLNIRWFWDLFKWMLMTERQQVSSRLSVRELKRVVHPKNTPVPTVDIDTRCRLEIIKGIKLDGYHPGLSDTSRRLVLDAFKAVITERKYTATFPMSQLHGFTASKSSMSSNRKRASQLTMADMGVLVDDLRDLKGLEGGEIIDACLAWSELRLNQGIRLYTDNWHRRFYWGNSGGSHHMAVLCYELKKQKREWCPEVEIHESVLDVLCLQQLVGKVSVFIMMSDRNMYGTIFDHLPEHMQYGDIQEKLGVTRVYFWSPWAFSNYQLVLVDHSREYSDLSHDRLLALVNTGYAMCFDDFLLAWMGHGAPEVTPEAVAS